MHRLSPGTQVAAWRVESWQAQGAYGAVYRAVRVGQEHLGPVALKLSLYPWDVRFAREAEVLSRLSHPGIPRLRLWREALEAGGRDASAYERSFDDMDKYTVPTDLERTLPAVPLSHLYLLEKAEGEPSIERLEGSAAVEAMIANTYRGAYVRMMGTTRQHLLACAELARTVPVFRARRRWGYDSFDSEGAALETHARQLILGS